MTIRLSVISASVVATASLHENTAPHLQSVSDPAAALWIPLGAALIGALSALATPFAKDLFIRRLNESRTKGQEQREIFRRYAAPLTMSSEKLMWRFSEIFIDRRHQFLKRTTRPLVYNEYKRQSTLYRIACVLGWIRAMQLELSALPRGGFGFKSPIGNAIKDLQGALADGPDVEMHRLGQIATVWALNLQGLDDATKRRLAANLEVKLYTLAGDTLKHDSDRLRDLDNEAKLAVCRGLARYLTAELAVAPVPEEVIAETLNRAVAALSYREALLYRDWQDAIGDVMLEIDPDSVRRFKIIGYQRFEEVVKADSPWMEVFRDSILDIDFDAISANDFRAQQLKRLASGVARILSSVSESEDRDLVDAAMLDVIERLAQVV